MEQTEDIIDDRIIANSRQSVTGKKKASSTASRKIQSEIDEHSQGDFPYVLKKSQNTPMI